MKTLIIIIILTIMAGAFYFLQEIPQWRLLPKLASQSLDEIKIQYANHSCTKFSDQEKTQGYFDALITGYCKPEAQTFSDRQNFLCAVGLNCSCPAGRSPQPDCLSQGTIKWSSCLDFDDQTTDYCHQTASQLEPQPGQVAADWSCFEPLSTIEIHDKTYTITDKGSAITGRRFDIWFDNCQDAFSALGIYKVTIP